MTLTALQTADQELDASGLNCPLPILKTQKAIKGLSDGGVLKVTATDPGSIKDMQAFCNQTGHELMASREDAGSYVFLIRKH